MHFFQGRAAIGAAIYLDLRAFVGRRGEDPDATIDLYIDALNDALRDRPAGMTVALHMCRGNNGEGIGSGGYEPIAERAFQRIDGDGFLLEYDRLGAGGFEPLRHLPRGKMVPLGLVSTKKPELEPADALKRRIDETSRLVDPDRLGICPQCGFASGFKTERMTPEEQERKLAQLVKVAGEVWGA